MMGDVVTATKSRTYAVQAGCVMIIAVIFASMTFNLFGFKTSFTLAPFIVLFLWPKGAEQNLSYIAIFISALLLDILTGEPLGGWALIYLPVFAILTQFSRSSETGFGETFISFLLALLGLSAFFLLVNFLGMSDVDLSSLLKMTALCVLLFPVIFFVKSKLRTVLVGEDG